jgi:Ham1 family
MHRQLTGRIVIATHNPGKLREMRELLSPYGIEAVSAGELGLGEPDETGATFRANARIKAQAAAYATNLPAFADDSGLAVDALGGEPGIHSARWAGDTKDFQYAMQRVEDELRSRGALTPDARPRRGLRGHGRRRAGLAAARHARLRLRSDVPAGRPHPHLRRDARRREARPAAARLRPLAPRPRVSHAGGGLPQAPRHQYRFHCKVSRLGNGRSASSRLKNWFAPLAKRLYGLIAPQASQHVD